MMKHLLFAVAAVALLAGCSKDDKQEDGPMAVTDQSYNGTVQVAQTYTAQNITAQVVKVDSKTLNIKMLKVKFAEAMPVSIDMTIPGVSYTATSSAITLSGNNIIPTAMGGAFEMYKITNLSGKINGSTLTLAMTVGTYPTTYSGTLVK